jgi:hypothetical protein
LDPVYISLNKMEMPPEQLARWLLAYWLTYHCGVASYLSELQGDDYWYTLKDAAWNDKPAPTGGRWDRSPERRHWRGTTSVSSVSKLMDRYARPEDFLVYVTVAGSDMTYQQCAERIKEHYAFGDWVAWKACDMISCLGLSQITFELSDMMYKDPEEAAVRVWLQKQGWPPEAQPRDRPAAVRSVVDWLLQYFKDTLAPPLYERDIGLQEVETILCCWKSHMNGHYELGHDIKDIRNGIAPWLPHSATAREFLHHFPPVPLTEQATPEAPAAGVG